MLHAQKPMHVCVHKRAYIYIRTIDHTHTYSLSHSLPSSLIRSVFGLPLICSSSLPHSLSFLTYSNQLTVSVPPLIKTAQKINPTHSPLTHSYLRTPTHSPTLTNTLTLTLTYTHTQPFRSPYVQPVRHTM